MTGFGRAEAQVGGTWFTVEAKSVNHRYLDARLRLPPALGQFELALADLLRSRFERGSFEVVVKQKGSGEGVSATGTRFIVDEVAALSLAEACEKLHKRIRTRRVPTLALLAATNRVFLPQDEMMDPKELYAALRPAVEEALAELERMREAEGARLEKVLREGIGEMTRVADRLAEHAPEQRNRIETKLKGRIAQWDFGEPAAASAPLSQRIEWEVAFYAERSDITEEIDRLRAHAREFADTLGSTKPIGRKLDFLTQELHREVNTVASKAAMIEITRLAVEGKTQIEKLREQVQNVE